ncbi:hypothetical protein SMU81_02692 [Streptococcus mutans SF14]|nr:hypothetical protein SMU81_02692 [Streptococcus mutans SF14]
MRKGDRTVDVSATWKSFKLGMEFQKKSLLFLSSKESLKRRFS